MSCAKFSILRMFALSFAFTALAYASPSDALNPLLIDFSTGVTNKNFSPPLPKSFIVL